MFKPLVTIGSTRWVVPGILLVLIATVPLRGNASKVLPPGGNVNLAPGTTAIAEPSLNGTVVARKAFPFLINPLGMPNVTCAGQLDNMVVRSNQTHLFDFYYRLTGLRGGLGMQFLATTGFGARPLLVDWRADLLPGSAPPVTATRGPAAFPTLTFYFVTATLGQPLKCAAPAGESRWFFVKTGAARFAAAGTTTLNAGLGQAIIRGTFTP